MTYPSNEDRFQFARPLAIVLAVAMSGCAASAPSGSAEGGLVQGVDQSGLWQSQTVAYCFKRPLLAEVPQSVQTDVGTQDELDRRWALRKQEFVGAVAETWAGVGVLNLVPQDDCTSGVGVVHYEQDTPTGGFAGIGRSGALSIGIQMDAKFLGAKYAWGNGTYHTFVAAHEFGHFLGFRHEQDRSDSTCHVSQDFSGTGILLTDYDPNSLMNYCDRQLTQLTDLDRQGFKRAYSFLGGGGTCQDTNNYCSYWASIGECSRNPGYMLPNCCASCSAGVRLVAPSGKCMDVTNAGTSDGTNIQLYTCNGTGAQSFRIDALAGGAARIVNVATGKCIDVSGAGTADGTNIQLYTCNDSGAQSFSLQDAGGGYSWLVNANSGKCVDIAGAKSQDGTNIQLWTCNQTDAQRWQPRH
jgi:hypothetical protein